MSGYGAIGGFATGVANGLVLGQSLRLRDDENRRREEEFGLRKRILKGKVEDDDRERADDEAIRAAGRNAIDTAMSARAPAPPVGAPTQGDTAIATPYVDPATGMAPRPTNSAPPPGYEGMASPQVQPINAGAAPAAGMTPRTAQAQTTPTEDDILAGLDASWKAALQRGRQDKGFEYFKNASGLREQLRNRALDNADRQYQATGDLSVFIEPYNRYVMDGGKVTGITKQADGKIAVGYDFGGKAGQRVMTEEELKKLILTMRDPAAMRKHELDMANALYKERIKAHTVADGGMVVSGDEVLRRGVVENPKDTKGKDSYITVKGPKDEGDRVYRITPDGLVDAAPGGEGGLSRRGSKFTGKENLPVHMEIMDIAEKEFGEWDPVTGKNVLKGENLKKALTRSSLATQVFEGAQEGGAQMDHATAYRIAQEGQTLPDAVFKAPDGRYTMQPAVRYNGQVYPLGGSKAVDVTERVQAAQKGKPGGGSPATAPKGGAPIDKSRPILKNADGSFSTERTITVEMDGKHLVIPTIVNGKQVSDDEAVKAYREGRNKAVGEFATAKEANDYAVSRSKQIGRERGAEARTPELVDTGLQRRSPRERSEAARTTASQARAASAQEAPRQRLAETFRSMVQAGRYTADDAPIIRDAMATGKLSEQEMVTAKAMLSKIESRSAAR